MQQNYDFYCALYGSKQTNNESAVQSLRNNPRKNPGIKMTPGFWIICFSSPLLSDYLTCNL
jgi:hypothetical protein